MAVLFPLLPCPVYQVAYSVEGFKPIMQRVICNIVSLEVIKYKVLDVIHLS